MFQNSTQNHTQWTDAQSQFYVDFRFATEPDKIKRSNRLWQGKAWIELGYYDEDCMELTAIEAVLLCRGWGSEALEWLKSLSDKYGTSIILDVEPMALDPDYPLSNPDALKAYYERRNFEKFDRLLPGQTRKTNVATLIYRPK